ncbi:unnamed protein product [Acidocella sp. C78]|nr:unnamed protein product [Acidocella sp. C78]
MPDTAPQTIDDFAALLAEERFALRHIGPGPPSARRCCARWGLRISTR